MEPPFKRSRLTKTSERLEDKSQPGANGSMSMASVANVNCGDSSEASDIEELQNYIPSFGRQFGSPEQLLPSPAPTITSSAKYERDAYPQDIESVVGAAETMIASVFDVIIDSGTTAVAQVTLAALPTGRAIISVPNIGPFTVSPPGSPDISSVQGAATASSNASARSSTVASSQSSLSIAVPNSSSQIVLSSPPSTPLPSSSSISLSSTFTDSYFSSFTTESTTSGGSSSVTPSTTEPAISGGSSSVTPSTTAPFSSFTATSNLTTSAFTFVSSDTTLIGTTTLNLESFSSNATRLVTSSTSKSHFTSVSSQLLTSSILSTSTSLGALRSSRSSHFGTSTIHSSTSQDSTSSLAASSSAVGTGGLVGGPGSPSGPGTATSTTSPSSTAAAGSGSNQSSAPPTPAVVGGVVGGLAGLTVLLVILLFILRWRRRKLQTRQLAGGDTEMAETNRAQPEVPLTQRSSAVPLATTGLAPFLRRLRSHSGQTAATTETAPSERGFQNLGGRRIESVLTSGGDGYGGPGPINPERDNNLSGSSFYRDSQGTYGGPGSLPSSMYVGPGSPPLSPTILSVAEAGPSVPTVPLEAPDRHSDKEVAIMRPSPARTPVTSQAAFTSQSPRATPPPRAPPSPRPPPIGDGVGRSHPSLDGSRSRFAEDLD
ncbi:hypothetical protein MMC14_005172 [Varicellaria rhodocarpa]|nr:hypothetical protein [Varicellaria rhodocarpa]